MQAFLTAEFCFVNLIWSKSIHSEEITFESCESWVTYLLNYGSDIHSLIAFKSVRSKALTLPWFEYLPALPAICAAWIFEMVANLPLPFCWVWIFWSVVKTTLFIFKFIPRPIASVAIKYLIPFFLPLNSWAYSSLDSAGRAPYRIAQWLESLVASPCSFVFRCLLIVSFSWYIFFLENEMKQSPTCKSSNYLNGSLSASSVLNLPYLWTINSSPVYFSKWQTIFSALSLPQRWISFALSPSTAFVQLWPLKESSIIWSSSITAQSYSVSKSVISMVHDRWVANAKLCLWGPVFTLQTTPSSQTSSWFLELACSID